MPKLPENTELTLQRCYNVIKANRCLQHSQQWGSPAWGRSRTVELLPFTV